MVVVAIIVANIGGLIYNRGKNDAAYNAGAAWAKNELAAGYARADPEDPDPCDDARALSFASAGYDFSSWDAGL